MIVPVMQLKSLVACASSYGIFNNPNIGVILEVGAALRWSFCSQWWSDDDDTTMVTVKMKTPVDRGTLQLNEKFTL